MGKRIHQAWPTWALTIGAVLAFFGERVFSASESSRAGLAAVAAIAVVAALGVRFNEFAKGSADKKPVGRLLLILSAGVAMSLVLYALIPLVFHGDSSASQRLRAVLWALWPITMLCSLLPLIAIELSVGSVAYIDRYEHHRIRTTLERTLSLGLLIASLFLVNFLAKRHNTKWDFSSGSTAKASPQTQRAVRDLTKPVKVILFFPKANEVAESVQRYFEPLKGLGKNITVQQVDHALASDLAKDTKVTENGYVALLHDKASEKIRVGTKATSARSNLRRFDQNVLKALIKVTTSKKVAYFTKGHDERATATPHKDDKRDPIKLIKRQLEAWQYRVKPLGVAEGLGNKIPDDATVVFIMGPERPFLKAEAQTIVNGLKRGVRFFIALEGERDGDVLKEILDPMGLEFNKSILANERSHAPLTKTLADHNSIWSNKYSSHASVTTMTRNNRLATLFSKTGSLKKLKGKRDKIKSTMVLTAVDDTFADLNGDLRFNKETEKKERFGLAAAVVHTSTTGKKNDEGRAFILSDIDVMSDKLLKLSQGNGVLFGDIIYWLQVTEEPIVPTIAEKDVRIVHKKEEDDLIFYGTTFAVPALLIALGAFMNRRRRS